MQYNYQYEDENLDFLKEKIKEIKIALFKSEIDCELQLPNNIIQTLKVEDDGTIWFYTSCNGIYAKNIDKPFYAYLNYYKKGTDCRLQVSGKAMIIKDGDEGLFSISNYAKGTYGKLVLVKMKMMQAEFYENKAFSNISWTEKIKSAFNYLFPAPTHRIYDFSTK
ncbi:MAG TPA: hypothetical protein VK489_05005 [Ferruginibacter sp.]|nr:hypothetical protein [Ferruginibacter sp.]